MHLLLQKDFEDIVRPTVRTVEVGRNALPAPRKGVVTNREKAVGGSGSSGVGDSSGVSQDQLGVMLKGFDELEAVGLLMVGPPGTGKSSIAKAAGATYGVPVIVVDFGAAKASLVGESEANSRQIFKIIRALGGIAGTLFIATSNRLESVPPELQRRLGKFGVWMVDLPSVDERAAIWGIQAAKWNIDLDIERLPDDDEWTGADIANCCELAHRMGSPLDAASEFLAPVAKSSPDAVRRIRLAAQGRFKSTSYPGFYRMPTDQQNDRLAESASHAKPGRVIRVED